MKAWQYILKRILSLIPVLVGVTILTFTISHIVPADPVMVALGPYATPEMVQTLNKKWGLDKPLYIQYLLYVKRILQGDLGTSLNTNRPVMNEILAYFPATLELTMISMLLSLVLGIPLGIIAATKKNKAIDHITRIFSLLWVSMPAFWLGLLMLLVFYFKLGVLPGGGRLSPFVKSPQTVTGLYILDSLLTGNWLALKESITHIIMPAFCLAFMCVGIISRMTRSSMLNVLGEDYIRMAEAKGLSKKEVIYIHALRNAILPVITISGVLFARLLGGTILAETIFSWPGMGRYAVTAIMNLDFQPIIGFTMIIAAINVSVNLLVDILYVLFDPRIRL